MLTCPRCRTQLQLGTTARGRRHLCATCSGHAVTYGGLRATTEERALAALWRAASGDLPRALTCPSCANKMAVVPLGSRDAPLHVDVCRACHLIWFDPGEEAQLPGIPQPTTTPSPEMQAALSEMRREEAMLQMRRLGELRERYAPPHDPFRRALGYLGVPAEEGLPPLSRLPLVTWILATLCLVLFALTANDPWSQAYLTSQLGFWPSQPWIHHGMGMVTTFFVHSGPEHLIANLVFLLVFGDNVEDLLGHGRYLLLVAVATACASWTHALITRSPDAILIGSSGGISALIAFYVLAFPRARLRKFIFISRPLRMYTVDAPPPNLWIAIPSRYYFGAWIVLQLILLLNQIDGRSTISAAAHLGGAAVGVTAWWWLGRGAPAR